jgi:hypothetical protein
MLIHIVTTILGFLLVIRLTSEVEAVRAAEIVAVIFCIIPLAGLIVAIMLSLKESPPSWWEYFIAAVLAGAIGSCVATVVIAGSLP